MAGIMSKAKAEWPSSYGMQLFEVTGQVRPIGNWANRGPVSWT